mgnify:CR=1 FL=1
MIEKLIVLEDIDPVIFYGVNNANMQLIKALYPKLRIVARGNVIKVLGDEEEMCAFEENITKLEKYCAEYNSLKEEVIIDIIKGNAPQAEKSGNVIVFSVTGKPIIPRSENQLKLVEAFAKNDMLFAIGPAGSGKTYTAIALAVRAASHRRFHGHRFCKRAMHCRRGNRVQSFLRGILHTSRLPSPSGRE